LNKCHYVWAHEDEQEMISLQKQLDIISRTEAGEATLATGHALGINKSTMHII
jgi:hypothetical protein